MNLKNEKEAQEAYLVDWFYENGFIEPKPESKEEKRLDNGKEVTVFLASGKTLHFTNVESCEEIDEWSEDGELVYLELVIKYHGKTTGKDRIVSFNLLNDNIIGYAADRELGKY